jgi:PTS system galactitol-specific IIB component
MAKELNIMVACGSGVATSTVAADAVKTILKDAGIQAKIFKCTLGELESKQKEVDLILTTANYKKSLEVPQMSVFGLVSGVNEDTVKQKLVNMCNDIIGKQG